MSADSETVILPVTEIAGHGANERNYRVIWRGLPIGRIKKCNGVMPSSKLEWS